jgi:hypothetical protein
MGRMPVLQLLAVAGYAPQEVPLGDDASLRLDLQRIGPFRTPKAIEDTPYVAEKPIEKKRPRERGLKGHYDLIAASFNMQKS